MQFGICRQTGATRRAASARFSADPDQVLLVDAIAHRYGKWPHEVLRLSPEELSMAICCVSTRNDADATAAKRSGAMGVVVING